MFLGFYGERVLDYHVSAELTQQTMVRKSVVEAMARASNVVRGVSGQQQADHSSDEAPGAVLADSTVAPDPLEESATSSTGINSGSIDIPTLLEELKRSHRSLFADLGLLLLDELAILTLILLIGIGIGYAEGWGIIERYVSGC